MNNILKMRTPLYAPLVDAHNTAYRLNHSLADLYRKTPYMQIFIENSFTPVPLSEHVRRQIPRLRDALIDEIKPISE